MIHKGRVLEHQQISNLSESSPQDTENMTNQKNQIWSIQQAATGTQEQRPRVTYRVVAIRLVMILGKMNKVVRSTATDYKININLPRC